MKFGLISFLFLTACSRAFDYSGPASPDALECALSQATTAGYELIEGSSSEGWLRLRQPIPPRPAETIPPPQGTVVNRPGQLVEPIENSLFIRVEGDQLRISVLGITEEEAEVDAGQDADAHALTILALCASPSPSLPASATSRPR